MELTKEQMKLVIRCLSDIKFLNQTNKNPFKSSIDLKELPTVIDLFKKYLNSGETKWLLQKLEKTNLNYLFKNLGGYSMDSKTRDKILHRCEILKYMGDDGIPSIYDQMTDMELYYDCIWVLDKAHDDLDNFQFSVTRKIINRAAARSSNDMWS